MIPCAVPALIDPEFDPSATARAAIGSVSARTPANANPGTRKFDGYRMHPRLDRGNIRLLIRTVLGWRGARIGPVRDRKEGL
jgi:hypothetical protein